MHFCLNIVGNYSMIYVLQTGSVLQEGSFIDKEAMDMAQSVDSVEIEEVTKTTESASLIQACKMLGKGYFLITLIGILSFMLLFFILWFM